MVLDRNAVTQEVPINPQTGKPYLNTVAAIQVSVSGAGSEVSPYVAQAVKVIRDSSLPQETNALFTDVEGDLDEVLHVAGKRRRSSRSKATAQVSCCTWIFAPVLPASSRKSRKSSINY